MSERFDVNTSIRFQEKSIARKNVYQTFVNNLKSKKDNKRFITDFDS